MTTPALSTAQRLALAEADGPGYRAIGSGRVRTAERLRTMGLVEIAPWNRWVTLTPKGREVLYGMQPSLRVGEVER